MRLQTTINIYIVINTNIYGTLLYLLSILLSWSYNRYKHNSVYILVGTH